jgi:hypothetical protein
MSVEKAEWLIRGVKRHNMIWFPIIEDKRCETVEETLSVLGETGGGGYSPRTTHLFRSDVRTLEKINAALRSNDNFVSSSLLHSASDLGIVDRIVAAHKSGLVFSYDGLLLRVTKTIVAKELRVDALVQSTGVPNVEWNVVNDFVKCVNEIFPEKHVQSIVSYYTVDETNWEKLGVQRVGDAQLNLVLKDPNYVTVTAIIFTKCGKDFSVYMGEEERIHQMIAHDLFIASELKLFTNFFRSKSKKVSSFHGMLKSDFGGIISPFWDIRKKYKKWNRVKETMRDVYAIIDLSEKGRLLSKKIEALITERLAFFNGPRQIWLGGEKMDTEEKIQHETRHFFEARLEDSKLKMSEEQPTVPSYVSTWQEFESTVNSLTSQLKELYQRERDMLTAFQTEFSMYSVWIALAAIVIALASLIIPR